jgi:predicted Zn-dependent peptidase
VLAFENTNAVARHVAQQQVVFGGELDPDEAIAALDAVTLDDVRSLAATLFSPSALSAAGIGPDEGGFRASLAPVSAALAA